MSSQKDDSWAKILQEYTSPDLIQGALQEKNSSEPSLVKHHDFSTFPRPQAILDLHGFTASQAQYSAESFLKNAFSQHLRTLRIIVGKGLHSKNRQAVLPQFIEAWLVDLKKQNKILGYRWERGGASVLVYLP